MESPAKSLEMEEGSMDPEPLLCPAPLLLVSPGGEEVGEEWGWVRMTDKNKGDRSGSDDALR